MDSSTSKQPWTESVNGTYDSEYVPFRLSSTYLTIDFVTSTVCFTTNVFGNTLTLVAISKFSSLREKSYTTLAALTVADLLVALKTPLMPLVFSINIAINYLTIWRITLGVVYFVSINALLQVLLVAADRFIAITWPFFYNSRITKPMLWLASLVVSMASFGLSVAYVSIYNLDNALQTVLYILDIGIYALAAIMMLFLHGKITYVARKHHIRIAVLGAPPESTTSDANVRKNYKGKLDRASKMMIAVVGAYLILGLPYILADIIFLSPWANEYFTISTYLRQYGSLLLTFNSSVNFFIYAVLNKRFHYAYKLLLTCKTQESNMAAFSTTQLN